MAGVKGRSGGARPGSGRKPKQPQLVTVAAPKPERQAPAKDSPLLDGIGESGFDPRPALEQVAMGLLDPSPNQMKALVALMPYTHTKRGEGGKKEQKQHAAEKVAGRFSAGAPPKLVAVGGRKG